MGGFGSAVAALPMMDVVVPVKDWRAGCVSGSPSQTNQGTFGLTSPQMAEKC